MKKAYLYCYKRELNNATLYYVNIVSRCLTRLGYVMDTVYDLKNIKKPDLIFTITCMCYVKAKICHPFVKTLSWIQGALYEEIKMNNNFNLLKRWALLATEFINIRNADFLFFVSERMHEYYGLKFGYKKTNYLIMPCYNCALLSYVDNTKYLRPTFVYAGSIDKWQSFDITLDTYSIIEKKIPQSKLYLYCKKTEQLMEMITSRGIKNYEIKYVPYEQLSEEIAHYKYGFILREKNWVNEVATPNKMNSYLASFIIPIYSNAVDEFRRNIHLGEFSLIASTPLNPSAIAQTIIEFEGKRHDYSSFESNVRALFAGHYNDDYYIERFLDTYID